MNLGMKIRLHRTAANMTQKELGDKLGVTPSAVTRWESGECFPRGEKLIKLAEALHCTIDELYAGDLLGESREENQK